ncbi:MAG: succinate dehydrogenase/fumarate reductase iron-sulfur subunit [Verrucomicrobia bacterium]|nr:succinate dehydrogenase/fumarate reductase iron-sulfur subunit [Verrucomicrobiota bacterium]MDA1045345.1 succinate dehydrogenase/fumarate reductase iron-sulfur subunit [Verrucomicrobiota bacterium]
MKLKLKIWRQAGPEDSGQFEMHDLDGVSEDCSFLEMLDLLNEQLLENGKEPVSFDHDCREGICGTCSLTINGLPHGPEDSTTTCQLHMRKFNDGETITIEPFRAKAFPVIRDLVVDRSAFDKIIQAGGYVSVRTGSAPDGNAIPIAKQDADRAMDAAACIGCGACVAACKNASAMLFTAAKAGHLNLLPQGQAEKDQRVLNMVATMDEAGFGNCRNYGECSAACPKDISLDFIAKLNRDYSVASVKKILS